MNYVKNSNRKCRRMQGQMENVTREMETLKKVSKELLEIKTSVMTVKNASDGFTSRLNIVKEKNQ